MYNAMSTRKPQSECTVSCILSNPLAYILAPRGHRLDHIRQLRDQADGLRYSYNITSKEEFKQAQVFWLYSARKRNYYVHRAYKKKTRKGGKGKDKGAG
jgi:ADP-heptose:LPS heptosyltransferase